ncbi:MAG: glycosyltransferase family 39 protein, partial [Anaerolineales bacterium]
DDMFQYDMLARSLASGNGYRWYAAADVAPLRSYLERAYGWDLDGVTIPERGFPTSFRPPGYPAFLAGIYLLTGFKARLAAARLAQAILGAALAPLTARLALDLGLSARAARWAGLCLAVYPVLWMYPLGLGSENLFVPLVLLSLLGLLFSGRSDRPASAVVPALALAAGTLTRGALAIFVPFAAYWLFRERGWRHSAVLTALTALGLLPWSVRNTLLNGRPSFVDNSAGYNLFVGYHPRSDGGFTVGVASLPLHILDDGERDRWSFAQAVGFIRDDPGRVPILLANRLVLLAGIEDRELLFFYSNGFFGPISQPWLGLAYLMLVLPWLVVASAAPFGLAAAFGMRQAAQPARLVLGLVASTLIAYLPILADARFHLPLVPTLAPFAAAAWTAPRATIRSAPAAARRLAWLALILLVVLWSADVARDWSKLVQVMSPGGHLLRLDY